MASASPYVRLSCHDDLSLVSSAELYSLTFKRATSERPQPNIVIPAKSGIRHDFAVSLLDWLDWTPTCVGVTKAWHLRRDV
jgi:hypothetical protein